ncbi:MAG: helix-turn-helix transcriptional regulator [Clostridia bacterium]|nr:helix-turn-helix transcriptional regulator [Clostridia bacterium]
MDILSNFAESLKLLMAERSLDCKSLSMEINHNIYAIYHWTSGKGKYMPSVDSLVKLADYFGCSLEYLLGMEQSNRLTSPRPLPNFGEWFKTVVKEKGYSLSGLAKQSHMNNVSFYEWINGARPSIDSLIKVAAVLECSLDYLIGREI